MSRKKTARNYRGNARLRRSQFTDDELTELYHYALGVSVNKSGWEDEGAMAYVDFLERIGERESRDGVVPSNGQPPMTRAKKWLVGRIKNHLRKSWKDQARHQSLDAMLDDENLQI